MPKQYRPAPKQGFRDAGAAGAARRSSGVRRDGAGAARPERGSGQGASADRGARREWYPRDDNPYRGRKPAADRGARPQRESDRTDRPQRDASRTDRPQRDASRTDRYNSADRTPDRRPHWARESAPLTRQQRMDAAFGPAGRAPRTEDAPPRHIPVDDVVHERLEATAVATDVEGATFGELGLGQNIVRALAELGAPRPFPIQAGTIPDILAGRDVLARGRTGSGKTIAFGAPVVERLLQQSSGGRREVGRAPRALILAPTRELALQIDGTVQPIARSVGLFTTQIYGGVPQARQVGALQRGVDIVIGTPGRVEDLIEQGRLNLSQVDTVVLDEADHMCDLGFLEPVQRILRRTRAGGQRLLFSATLDDAVARLVNEFLVDPSVVEVAGDDDQASSTIEHRVLVVEQRDKVDAIADLVRDVLGRSEGKVLIFARTRSWTEELADHLEDRGIDASRLHGDLSQSQRTRNLDRLSKGRARVLVATDVAARGLHVDDIDLVIQADPADDHKTYLHRAGRTGRAGRAGVVVSLATPRTRRRIDGLLQNAGIVATTQRASR